MNGENNDNVQTGRGVRRKRYQEDVDDQVIGPNLKESKVENDGEDKNILIENQDNQYANEDKQEESSSKNSVELSKSSYKEQQSSKNKSNYQPKADSNYQARGTKKQYQNSNYKQRLISQIEHLESKDYLTISDQSKLNHLQNKLHNLQTKNSEYNLPTDSNIDKQDLLKNDKREGYKSVNWETEQFEKAKQLTLQNDDKILPDNNEYDFVFDESNYVNYEQDEELKGNDQEENEPQNSKEVLEIEEVKKSLPVYKYKDEFLKVVKENQVLIVVGETGSGKTTQLPQYLYEAGYSQNGKFIIGCTQPRRVAATSVASRVAQELQVKLGNEIGYSIRFDDKSSSKTLIKYLTDGMLLREFLNDSKLSNYSCIMIDEAHERTISTEILLSLLKDITNIRSDLKIIIASATINAKKFSDFFGNAPILNIPGRRFPVKIHYTKQPEANYLQACLTTIFQIHLTQELPGDILVFLTGQEEIEQLQEMLNDAIDKLKSQLQNGLYVCSIYANLPPDLQQKIFEPTPPKTRKIVLATNIAETSITIPGISFVIDPGYVKQNVFNSTNNMESLVVVPCSKANCDQRAGRAGRIGPGKCFRLFTKQSFDSEFEMNQQPEIQRTNLVTIILLLLSLGINDLINFEFLDPPNKENIIKTLNLLYSLGALNSQGKLTKTGRKMSEFPINPIMTKCILTSERFNCVNEILTLISMLGESSNLFFIPKNQKELFEKRITEFKSQPVELGDFFILLNIYKSWRSNGYSKQWCQDYFIQYKTMRRVKNVYEQLYKLTKKIGISFEEEATEIHPEMIIKCLLSGFFNNIVKLNSNGQHYIKMKNGGDNSGIPLYLHPSSSLYKKRPRPKYLMYYELTLTSKEYMRNCIILDDKLIKQYLKQE
ncbi:unnamed protein product [Candida verbasci]|uniref:RNA helicase n=1 Tax=Candida verbasci TaxID=1227364 RepID=A0A9W4XM47_9ASCO|nr:unnamed protein product [Candida verbasci]